MGNLRDNLKKINIEAKIDFNEAMSNHTTFKTGGKAEVFAQPYDINSLRQLLKLAKQTSTEVFVFGGGANILVSDSGIPGLVISTKKLTSIRFLENNLIEFGSGISIDTAAEEVLDLGLSGMDSFYGMPGSIGGAIWMNARCYGNSISDIIVSANYLDSKYKSQTILKNDINFDYKHSIFQEKEWIITDAVFSLSPAAKERILKNMDANKQDRKNKGHYAFPSAGSVFKNNRKFGKPSGAIIDSLGLRGYRIGDAMVSKQHANIIINCGHASSADIKELIFFIQKKVKKELDIYLEPEIQFIGDL